MQWISQIDITEPQSRLVGQFTDLHHLIFMCSALHAFRLRFHTHPKTILLFSSQATTNWLQTYFEMSWGFVQMLRFFHQSFLPVTLSEPEQLRRLKNSNKEMFQSVSLSLTVVSSKSVNSSLFWFFRWFDIDENSKIFYEILQLKSVVQTSQCSALQ